MDLEEFRAFIAVVETGSFLAPAINLNLARATLRRRVDALEARAGVPLLERSARGVVVTEAGSLLASRGRQVLQEASALVASVREIGREPVGVLRVGGIGPNVVRLLNAAGVVEMPLARIAVLDGIRLSPNQPVKRDGLAVNTLWGELAWQLRGAEGYAMVREADESGTSPGKGVVADPEIRDVRARTWQLDRSIAQILLGLGEHGVKNRPYGPFCLV